MEVFKYVLRAYYSARKLRMYDRDIECSPKFTWYSPADHDWRTDKKR